MLSLAHLAIAVLLLDALTPAEAAVTIAPAPPGEALCEDYTVRVNGQPVPVYACRVSAMPFNQVWPGYQRPVDQSEIAGFAYWDMSAPVTVEVTADRDFANVAVRPSSRKIRPTVRGRRITFRVSKPGPLTVELDGTRRALHLFASPPEKDAPAPNAPNVLTFGPGVHSPGKISLKSGQTLYVAGGAVVYTAVDVHNATGVRIRGRGVIDTSEFERDKGGGCIRLTDSSDIKIEGVILRDPDVWTLAAFGCRDIDIANVKLIGLWRYNADGIDICNTQNVTIRDCFVRSFDDGVVVKGLNWGPGSYFDRPCRDVHVSGTVVWCDWGRALEIGAETSAPEIADIVYRDCDVIRTTHVALDIQAGDRAAVHDIRYENIRVEIDDHNPNPMIQQTRESTYPSQADSKYVPELIVIVLSKNVWSQDKERGTVRDVLYKGISVTSRPMPASWFRGLDAEHGVSAVTIDGLRFNGKLAGTPEGAHLAVQQNVSDVRFGTTGR